jgi:hypothetical protein
MRNRIGASRNPQFRVVHLVQADRKAISGFILG